MSPDEALRQSDRAAERRIDMEDFMHHHPEYRQPHPLMRAALAGLMPMTPHEKAEAARDEYRRECVVSGKPIDPQTESEVFERALVIAQSVKHICGE